jgi:hypothetical protein
MLALQQQAAETQRQQMLQSLLLQQQALSSIPGVTIGPPPLAVASTAAASAPAAPNNSKKAREIYVGNLVQGTMTPDLVKELFNLALANFVPDPINNPPIMDIKMDATGARG